jgi:hypothetical protein
MLTVPLALLSCFDFGGGWSVSPETIIASLRQKWDHEKPGRRDQLLSIFQHLDPKQYRT